MKLLLRRSFKRNNMRKALIFSSLIIIISHNSCDISHDVAKDLQSSNSANLIQGNNHSPEAPATKKDDIVIQETSIAKATHNPRLPASAKVVCYENTTVTPPENSKLFKGAQAIVALNDNALPANHAPENTAIRTEAIDVPCPDIRSFAALCNAQHHSLSQIKEDPDPEVLFAVESKNIGRHYLISDEKHPDLFRSSIENKGGTYMGVGFEQGYLYIGWQRPSLAFLIDYDPWIILNHRILIEIMKQCPNAECLFDYFYQSNLIDDFMHIQTTLVSTLASKSSRHRILRLRHVVSKALVKLSKSELPNMMNTPDIYNNIRTLALTERLRIVQANLLASQGIHSIANTLNALGAKLDTLYISNAEQYWDYSNQFKSNMLSLPFAEDGIIMRTRATYPHNGDYRYSIQNASIFKSWMSSHKTKSVKQITKHVKRRDIAQFSLIVDDLTPEAP